MTDDTEDTTPWLITAPPNAGEVIGPSNAAVWGNYGDLVAEVVPNPAYGIPALDRARLIAAAPDLLDAAKALIEDSYHTETPNDRPVRRPPSKQHVDKLQDAVKKAEQPITTNQ